jgi:DNA-binding NtrC family response regulator
MWNHRVSDTANKSTGAEVLVIDDDAIMRDLLADWLEAAGYRVRKAGTCTAVFAELKRAAPAVIVSDMCMPGPSGVLAIAKLKEGYPGVRLIAVSGHFNSGQGLSAEAALKAGAARALAKPVKRGDLLRAVAELVGSPGA